MKKYLIYKISGGLCHMMAQINSCIELSIKLNRHLIIDCNGGAFNNDFNKYFNIPTIKYETNYNNFEYSDKYKDYIEVNCEYHPKGYKLLDKEIRLNINQINNNDDVIFCSWFDNKNSGNNIKVNKDILEKIKQHQIQDKYIGVHYRNTDHKTDINQTIKEIQKHEKSNIKKILLATDDYKAFDLFKSRLPNYEIIQITKPYVGEVNNIHYGNPNKDEVIINALIDIYLLTKANIFIPCNISGFSRFVKELRVKDNFFN